MNDGFQFIDIIFFAMVAAFLVLRLRSVLGRRTGHERQRPDPFARGQQAPAKDNVVELPTGAGRPATRWRRPMGTGCRRTDADTDR